MMRKGMKKTSISDLKALRESPHVSKQMKGAITKELGKRKKKKMRY